MGAEGVILVPIFSFVIFLFLFFWMEIKRLSYENKRNDLILNKIESNISEIKNNIHKIDVRLNNLEFIVEEKIIKKNRSEIV